MSGYPGDLSPKQATALEQFKQNLKDVLRPDHDDFYLTKWLRARVWDLKKSEKMLRDSLEWRRKYGTDTIVQDYKIPEVLDKYYPGGYCGVDKEGCPVWVDYLGHIDLKNIFLSARKHDLVKYRVYYLEVGHNTMVEESKKRGVRKERSSLIFDMDGIGMKHLWKTAIDAFIELLVIYEANYPETLKTAFVVNAPAIFPIAYNLVKPFLSEDTKKKIVILGSDWKQKLLQDIDADQLPVNWGGTKTGEDGNPYCVNLGGKIPESYHITNTCFDMSKFTAVNVPRSKSLELEYPVKEAGFVINWQFWTDGNDIAFGVSRKGSDGKLEELRPSERCNSHMVPEHDSITCTQPGTYILKFDNTYSWVTGKQLHYSVDVLEPDNESFNTQL